MSIQLKLPNEIELKVVRQAALAGQDVTTFVVDAIRDKLHDLETNGAEPQWLSPPDWSARLQNWVDSFPAVSHAVDDSRESIYPDRA